MSKRKFCKPVKSDDSFEHREKWLNAHRLLTAKKNIDSILYIGNLIKSPDASELKYCNINIKTKVDMIRRSFYIECGILLDKIAKCTKGGKRELCRMNRDAKAVYYERDKNSAHADEDYKPTDWNSLSEMAGTMKRHLKCVRSMCDNILPHAVKLEYVAHDSELFRIIHGISPEKELDILKKRHPLFGKRPREDGLILKIFSGLDQLNDVLTHKDEYGIICNNGICDEESLQCRQDAFVLFNILWGYDVWVSKGVSFGVLRDEEFVKTGMVDEFGGLMMTKILRQLDIMNSCQL